MSCTTSDGRVSRPPWHQRPWLIMGVVAMLLLGLLIYLFVSDSAPPEDADLLPAATSAADPQNPLAVFCRKVGDRAHWDFEGLPPEAQEYASGQEAALKDFVGTHERESLLLHGLMETDASTWNWPAEDESQISWKLRKYCFGAARVCESKAILLARSGRTAEATEEAMMVAKFGHLLQMLPDDGFQYRLSMFTQERAEGLLKECLKDCEDQTYLKHMQEALVTLEPSIEAQIVVEKNDYMALKQWMVKLDQGDSEAWHFYGDPSKKFLQFRLNRTLGVHVERLRPTIKGLESDWLTGLRAMDRSSLEAWDQGLDGWRQFVSMNRLGHSWMGEYWSRSAGAFGNGAVSRVARHRMTVVTLALRRHELVHGTLPARLEELVPVCLSAVPLDPFSNQSFRWDAGKRLLYSVGMNGTDDHGDETQTELPGYPTRALHAPHAARDIVMPYDWPPATVSKK